MTNRKDSTAYPPELNAFVAKRMLFKVEVSDANLYRNWHSFTVKKLTDDDDIIKKFLTLHGLNVGNNGDEGVCVGVVTQIGTAPQQAKC